MPKGRVYANELLLCSPSCHCAKVLHSRPSSAGVVSDHVLLSGKAGSVETRGGGDGRVSVLQYFHAYERNNRTHVNPAYLVR